MLWTAQRRDVGGPEKAAAIKFDDSWLAANENETPRVLRVLAERSNGRTYLVQFNDSTLGVWKPLEGNPRRTPFYLINEVIVYRVSQLLGLDVVPPTESRFYEFDLQNVSTKSGKPCAGATRPWGNLSRFLPGLDVVERTVDNRPYSEIYRWYSQCIYSHATQIEMFKAAILDYVVVMQDGELGDNLAPKN